MTAITNNNRQIARTSTRLTSLAKGAGNILKLREKGATQPKPEGVTAETNSPARGLFQRVKANKEKKITKETLKNLETLKQLNTVPHNKELLENSLNEIYINQAKDDISKNGNTREFSAANAPKINLHKISSLANRGTLTSVLRGLNNRETTPETIKGKISKRALTHLKDNVLNIDKIDGKYEKGLLASLFPNEEGKIDTDIVTAIRTKVNDALNLMEVAGGVNNNNTVGDRGSVPVRVRVRVQVLVPDKGTGANDYSDTATVVMSNRTEDQNQQKVAENLAKFNTHFPEKSSEEIENLGTQEAPARLQKKAAENLAKFNTHFPEKSLEEIKNLGTQEAPAKLQNLIATPQDDDDKTVKVSNLSGGGEEVKAGLSESNKARSESLRKNSYIGTKYNRF